MQKDLKQLLLEANQRITQISVEEALNKVQDDRFTFIDVRDLNELENDGKIPGAVHISRGMLEYNIDEASPYYNEVFKSGKNYVFYCKSGGRSALAASRASEMGVKNILNLTGGFINWKKTNGPVED